MKYILRTALGVVFTFFFLAFLLVSALRFELLSTKFWTKGVERSGMYQDLVLQVEKMQAGIDKQGGGLNIKGIITEARLREVVEVNVERLVDFLNGKSKTLALSLPLNEWNVPREVLGGLPKIPWGREIEISKALASLGFPAEQSQSLLKSIDQVQQVLSWLVWVWLGLLAVALVFLFVHYVLGDGKVDKVKGSGILLLGSGLIAALIGWGGGQIGSLVAQNSKDWPAWAKMIVSGLAAEFFSLGKMAGLVTAVIGIGLFVYASRVLKEVKGKEAKKMSFMGKLFKTSVGIVLGIFLLLSGPIALGLIVGGKVSPSVTYESKFGWSMNQPSGWKLGEFEKSAGFKSPDNAAFVEAATSKRLKQVDNTKLYLDGVKLFLTSGEAKLKNLTMVSEPTQDSWNGWKRFIFVFEYDSSGGKRIRQVRWELYPESKGDGFVLRGEVLTEQLSKYEKVIRETMESFTTTTAK